MNYSGRISKIGFVMIATLVNRVEALVPGQETFNRQIFKEIKLASLKTRIQELEYSFSKEATSRRSKNHRNIVVSDGTG